DLPFTTMHENDLDSQELEFLDAETLSYTLEEPIYIAQDGNDRLVISPISSEFVITGLRVNGETWQFDEIAQSITVPLMNPWGEYVVEIDVEQELEQLTYRLLFNTRATEGWESIEQPFMLVLFD